MSAERVFGIQQPDGTWAQCDEEMGQLLEKAMADFMAGTPGSVVVRDEGDEPHVLSHVATSVLRLALLAMDARLRPGEPYRKRADELYTLLATLEYQDAVSELRRVFSLPWVMK